MLFYILRRALLIIYDNGTHLLTLEKETKKGDEAKRKMYSREQSSNAPICYSSAKFKIKTIRF